MSEPRHKVMEIKLFIDMEKKKIYIKEDGAMDFDKFNLLTEAEQINEMEFWTPQQWIAYKSQTPALTRQEVYNAVMEIIKQSNVE